MPAAATFTNPLIEILYFDGCPNHEPAQELVADVLRDLGIDAEVRTVNVPTPEDAERQRFLGSPSIRVNGRDVEPGADLRKDFGLTCRVFRTSAGLGPAPDREWLADALRTTGATKTLRAAHIPDERCGHERTARLTDAERSAYIGVLNSFAAGSQPHLDTVTELALNAGADPDAVVAKLATEDLVHLDADGHVTVAYPFSGRNTQHRVRIGNGPDVRAMCAIDALGIAYMLQSPVTIESRDPISDEPIHVQLTPGHEPTFTPSTAVVLAGSTRCDGPSHCGCCNVLNFFVDAANASRYLATQTEVSGFPISIAEAAEAGRAVFEHAMHTK